MLNIGCGSRYHKDWTNIDIKPTDNDVIKFDLNDGLPFNNESFEVIYHSHVLEHLNRSSAENLMLECNRVLKKNGVLRVVVPDLEKKARLYLDSLNQLLDNPDDQECYKKYEWSVIDLLDQMVRTNSGGELKKFLYSANKGTINYLKNLIGNYNVDKMLKKKDQKDENENKYLHKILEKLKSINIKKIIKKSVLKNSDIDLINFQNSGEKHLQMYDSVSLFYLFKKNNFKNIKKVDAHKSSIPNWNSFSLDVLYDEEVYLPESIWFEGQKSN